MYQLVRQNVKSYVEGRPCMGWLMSLQQLLSIRSAKSLAANSDLSQLPTGYLLRQVHSTGKTLVKLPHTTRGHFIHWKKLFSCTLVTCKQNQQAGAGHYYDQNNSFSLQATPMKVSCKVCATSIALSM